MTGRNFRRDCLKWRTGRNAVAGDTRDGESGFARSHATGLVVEPPAAWRHDFGVAGTDWLALGVEGIAPRAKVDCRRERALPAKAAWRAYRGAGLRPGCSASARSQPRLEASGYAGHDAPR